MTRNRAAQLLRETPQGEFLYDPETYKLIDEIYRKAQEWCTETKVLEGLQPDDSKHNDLLEKRSGVEEWQIRKEFGTAEKLDQREWRGRITLAVTTVPDIDRYHAVFQSLGERFVMIRWPRAGGIEAALSAMNQNVTAARAELRQAVHRLLNSLPSVQPQLSGQLQRQIAALSEFADLL